MHRRPNAVRTLLPALGLVAAMVLAACGDGTKAAPAGEEGVGTKLRLGYFPNLTHATAIAGVEKGIFEQALRPDTLEVFTFNAGPSAVEALFSGALDATYIGPNPAINAFVKSKGEAVRIVSGATSGGASLVVQPEVTGPRQLKGKKLATPQLGGTQDVALRHWLGEQGMKTDRTGGGDVSILPQENAQTLETFKLGQIDGAWVPEPWATRLRLEGGGKVLLDERSLWPGGRFVTTHLVVRSDFLERHPATVRRLLQGQVAANDLVNADAGAAQKLVNDGIEKITTKRLKNEVVQEAWKNLELTNDPITSSLSTSAQHAKKVGLLETADLDGIYDLTLLNDVLKSAGQKEIVQ
ncbi:MAG TPA: ABC transporter substrate-binding protein [Acidimicrobiales bacterium]|nr:ABC transporter substrate-binding protein [Acidimicrobiales bacterium]